MVTIKLPERPVLGRGRDVMQVDRMARKDFPGPFALVSLRLFSMFTKPFCDGTHSKAGFKAAEAAVPGSQDKPAI